MHEKPTKIIVYIQNQQMHVYISEEINGDKYKNDCIKLRGEVGMAVPKIIQTSSRYHHIHVYGVSGPSLLIESIDSMKTMSTFS